MDLAKLATVNTSERSRFELKGEYGVAFIDYKIGKTGKWYLVHTEVPKQWEGKGVGHKIVRETLAYLDKKDEKIVPLCPFIHAFIKRNLVDYQHMLAEDVKM